MDEHFKAIDNIIYEIRKLTFKYGIKVIQPSENPTAESEKSIED